MNGKEVAIVGVGIHKFGRFGDKSLIEMAREAVKMALKDANMSWQDIQAVYSGASQALSMAGVNVANSLGRTGVPNFDVRAACAAGGVCLRQGVLAIQSGAFDRVVCSGVEKMPRGFMDPVMLGFQKWQIQMGMNTNPSYWSMAIRRHMHDYGSTELQLAKIAYKNHKYSVYNPYAMYQKEFTIEEILASPIVCYPIHLYEICAPNEGAAAVILCPLEKAHKYNSKPIILAASAHVLAMYSADFRSPITQMSARISNLGPTVVCGQNAYEEAGIGPEDIDVAELQDTDASTELTHYEELGWCPVGEGGRLVDEGETELGGRIPVNLSGGLISKGEPAPASHLGQVVDLVWQLRGQLGPRTVEGAKVALAQVTGGEGHSAVTILKK